MSRRENRRRARAFSDDDSDDNDRSGRGEALKRLQLAHRSSGRVYDGPEVDYSTPRRDSLAGRPSLTFSASGATPGRTSLALPQQVPAGEQVFKGLLAATVTPMLSNGQIDADAIFEYGQALKADGVAGVFCNGTTGESMSLSMQERKILTEKWVATGLKVCTHIGCYSVVECCELAAHAEQCGAHGIAVMCPAFFKPLTINEYVDFLSEVSRAAPRIPLLIYHFPVLTGISFRLVDIMKACIARGTVPNLRGAKFTNLDFGDFAACQNLKGNITEMLYSQEQNIAGAAFLGATAFVGMQFSVVGPMYVRMAAAAGKGDQATTKALQKLVVDYINMVCGIVGPSVEKAIAATKLLVSLRLERPMGETRAPGAKLTVHEAQQLKDGMETFVKNYAAALKSLGGSSAPAAAPAAINVKAMEGYRGLLDDKIAQRIEEVSRRTRLRGLKKLFPHLHNPNWRKPMPSENVSAAQFIDHTVLKPECTAAEITKLCDEAKKNKFYAVCVNGSRVQQCLDELSGTDVHVAAVIGFPLGAGTIKAKAREAKELVQLGVDEIDMVMNIGAFKDGNYKLVYDDIAAVVEASAPAIVKVIFETCLLTRDDCIDACILSVAAGAHFVKTSTGFNKGGATPEMIDAMLATVGNEALVKASGGVRDGAAAAAYISAGVSRIGTSSGIAIISGAKSGGGY